MRSIILDFDYTLFDATNFKKDLAKGLKSFGVDENLWQETYQQIRYRGGKEADYIPKLHLQILSEKTGADFAGMKKAYDVVIHSADKYLHNDSIKFLEILKKKKYILYLLTFGSPDFQKRKIKASGIEEYLKKIICTDKNKFEVSDKINDVDQAIFINDNPNEIAALRKIHPRAQFVQIMRPNGKKFVLKLKNIRVIKSLKEF